MTFWCAPSSLIDTDKLLLPQGLPKRLSADFLASQLYNLHSALAMLKGMCGIVGGRTTRAHVKVIEEVVNPAYKHLNGVILQATSMINEGKADAARSSIVKLTDAERNRRFLEGGVFLSEDETMRYCPYCGCKNTVDVPVDNKLRMERNEVKLQEYRQA